jgi:CBS domain-containing protein
MEVPMQKFTVKELMVPLSEYATTPVGTTLFDAVMALEKAQEEFDHTKYRHRAVLVLDANKRVVGKVSQMDVLRALEPKGNDEEERLRGLDRFGFSRSFVWNLRKSRRLRKAPLKDLCQKAGRLKVEDIMQTPAEGEYINQDAPLDEAVQQLVWGNHLSLLVTRGDAIVGVLRLTDAFAAVFHAMKECEISPGKDES